MATDLKQMDLTDIQRGPANGVSDAGGLHSTLSILKSKLRIIGLVTMMAGAVAGLVQAFIPSYYTATSTIVVPSQSRSLAGALLAEVGPIAALAGDLGNKDSSDRYISLLKSNSVSDALIGEYNLKAVYKKTKVQQLRDELADRTRFKVLKGGLISIAVTDVDPRRAAELANGYVEQLYKLNSRLAIDEAAQRREFYQQQVDTAKEQLSTDEQKLKDAQERTGLIQPDAQAKGVIETIVRLRTEIASKEVEIRTLQTSLADSNPDLVRLRTQLTGLRMQVKKLEDTDAATGLIGTRELPSAGLEYARRVRDVKVDEAIVAALLKEFEGAKIDEAKSAPLVQMVDQAQAPDQKSGPYRVAIILGAMLSGMVCSIAYVMWGGVRLKTTANHILSRVDAL
jgi:tyrosine-protein kinase Etk/Wzc